MLNMKNERDMMLIKVICAIIVWIRFNDQSFEIFILLSTHDQNSNSKTSGKQENNG